MSSVDIDDEIANIRKGGWPRYTPAGFPVPAFLEALTRNQDGRAAFKEMIKPLPKKLSTIFLFALEAAHRRRPIKTMEALAKQVALIGNPGYDFTEAHNLHVVVLAAFQHIGKAEHQAKKEQAELLREQSPEKHFQKQLQSKQLPSGKDANLALIRQLVTRPKDPT